VSRRVPLVSAVAALGALGLAACGGSPAFRLTSEDNDPARLSAAFGRAEPAPAGPLNATGKPLAFLVARGATKSLIAFDLEAKKELWRTEADVTSKVVVGGRFIAHLEGDKTLVGRAVTSGEVLWRRPIGGTRFVGAAADASRVYYTAEDKSGKPTWTLYGLDGVSGKQLWSADAPGALGAPAARGGLVFSPFLKQWLAILDGKTGEQLTRIRGIDEEITFARTTKDHVYFGSSAGVFLLDERAASGKRAQSTYGKAELPREFIRVSYGWDAFDPVQSGYSAYDRNRLLWRGEPQGEALGFTGDRIVVASYRFFFGFAASSGKLAWAYSFPRVDVIGSAHLGPSIGLASMLGELGALDPAAGRRIYQAKVEGQLIGATFDAEGFAPNETVEGDAMTTAEALTAIARDRDARFTDVKKFAIAALSTLEGGGSTGDLVALVTDERTPANLFESAVESLVARRDPAGLPALVAAISIPYDHLAGSKPRAVGALARAIAGLAGLELDAAARGKAVEALLDKLTAPELPGEDLTEVVKALGAIGVGAELAALTTFVLVYRADPAFGSQPAALGAAIDVLIARGGGKEREAVAFVAADPRSQDEVAAYARRALLQGSTPAN
jgi:outer membrane protein assembly factor BamB